MAVHHPSEVTRSWWTKYESQLLRPAADQAADRGHRGEQTALVLVGELLEQRADPLHGPLVEQLERGLPGLGEPEKLAAPVVVTAFARDQASAVEPGKQPACVAGVEIQAFSQFGDVELVLLGQFEEDAGFAQRVLGVCRSLVEHADDAGVQAVEGTDRGDTVRQHQVVH